MLNNRKFWFFIVFICSSILISAQDLIVRGTVFDKSTQQPLIGVNVSVVGFETLLGTTTDDKGNFEIKGLAAGRLQFEISYVGYQTQVTEGIIITAQRIPFVEIGLQEGIVLEGIQVVADGNANAPINELATVSARSFSVEETERIAASINDMGRMALSFPGVQQGGDDTENDIIIRGNSSVGMLWRLEGIDIPNPNHFARPGTSGGGITIFSAQLLSKSDFYTGGMPAEFGNAISGAFDVHFRKGNNLDRQHRVRIGLLGLDFATEGPITKGKSSYLINYRYSTLGLLNKMGFHLIGERVSNDFQDLSFNLAFEGKDPKVKWTVFGIGGLSLEHYSPVENPDERDQGIANHWEDRNQGSNMAALGTTYTKLFNDKSYLKGTVALMSSYIFRKYDTLSLADVPYRYNTQDYYDSRLSTAWTYRKEFNDRWMLKTGTIMHGVDYTFYKEAAARKSLSDITGNNREQNFDGQGIAYIGQLYGLAQYNPAKGLDINAGLHALYLGINSSFALDPRLSMKYSLGNGHQLGMAVGRYSQALPLAAYFYEEENPSNPGVTTRPNFNAPMLASDHYILSYTYVTNNLLKLNAEVYYQKIKRVPVLEKDTEGYWMLNNQADFPQEAFVSEGKGENFGLDIDAEKFFSNNFYFLLTASFFESDYILKDKTRHPTRFSTGWVSGLTIGKEFVFKNKSVLQVGGRSMYNGGFRYTPFDPILSAEAGQYIPLRNEYWSGQVGPYFRIDARISYRYSKKAWGGNISLDVQNVTSRKNQNRADYDASKNELTISHYPGGDFIPVLAFTFDF